MSKNREIQIEMPLKGDPRFHTTGFRGEGEAPADPPAKPADEILLRPGKDGGPPDNSGNWTQPKR